MTLIPPISGDDHAAGPPDAPVTLVEYGDYQCPHCAAAELLVREIQDTFGDELRYVFRNFPLTEVHPAAEPAAESAEAAGRHGKFWDANRSIFAWNRQFGPESLGLRALETIGSRLGLGTDEVDSAVMEHRFIGRIRRDFKSGVRSGVNGTPTFFINGERYDGALTFEDLGTALAVARMQAVPVRTG